MCKFFCGRDSEETHGNLWDIICLPGSDAGKETVFPTKVFFFATDELGLGPRKVHNHGSEDGSCSAVSLLGSILPFCGHISVPLGWLVNQRCQQGPCLGSCRRCSEEGWEPGPLQSDFLQSPSSLSQEALEPHFRGWRAQAQWLAHVPQPVWWENMGLKSGLSVFRGILMVSLHSRVPCGWGRCCTLEDRCVDLYGDEHGSCSS